MIYTLTLNPAIDYYISLDDFKLGKLNEAKKSSIKVGGKGINVSIMLKNLGCDSKTLGFRGGFTGKIIEDELIKFKIDDLFINTNVETRINLKINDGNFETEISGNTKSYNQEDMNKLFKILKNLNSDDILVLSGSIPKGISKNIYYEISKNTKAKTILDTRGANLLENVYNNILIKPNIYELEEAFNKTFKNELDIYDSCKFFFEKNVENILISMGKEGAILINKNSILKGNIPKGNLINSVGAGDSSVAGFIFGYINNYNNIDILKQAIACGSSTAYSESIGDKEMINNLINNITITEVKK